MDRQWLTRVWSAAGGEPDGLPPVSVHHDGPDLLPAVLPAAELLVVSVAASTAAASVLAAVRGGRRAQPVRVDAEHVAVAAVSERYARRAGAGPAGTSFAPLSRFWRTRDGWLRMHGNYPWHRDRALRLLGVDPPGDTGAELDLDRVQAAVAAWEAVALEEALARAGALGAAVRTPEQWRRSPQGQAVHGLPLLQVGRSGGRARRLAPAGRPAEGVRVLDLTRVIAGPVATRTLAAWGADVLHLDPPALPELAQQALDMLPGKRSALVDLAAHRDLLDGLLRDADVLVHGYRPGSLDRFGLSSPALRTRHPGLVVVRLSAWGSRGPWAQRRGFDSLVQAASGIAVLEGYADRPGALPAQALDHATGYLGAAAALLALAAGEARHIDLALASTAHALLARQRRGPPRGVACGTEAPGEARLVDVARYLVTLPGPGGAVSVVAPPGIVGDDTARWTSTDELGGSSPRWR